MAKHSKFYSKLLLLHLTYGIYCWPFQAGAQTFQNDGFSCQDIPVVGAQEPEPFASFGNPHTAGSIVCAQFNGDDSGFDFPDCVTVRAYAPHDAVQGNAPTHSLLLNAGAHGANCVNAGGANSQFSGALPLTDQHDDLDGDRSLPFASLAPGNIDGENFADFAYVTTFVGGMISSDPSLRYVRSVETGGFVQSFQPFYFNVSALPESPLTFSSVSELYFRETVGGEVAEPSLILADCDEDGLDDAILGAHYTGNTSGFMVYRNQDGVVQNTQMEDRYVFPINTDEVSRVSPTLRDFDQDGDLDLIATIYGHDDSQSFDAVVYCAGDGACGFDCPAQDTDDRILSLDSYCSDPNDCNPMPSSIAAGDFNGDGLVDVAFSEAALARVRYLFNVAGSKGKISTWTNQALDFSEPGLKVYPYVLRSGRFTEDAIRLGVDEVAVSLAKYSDLDNRIQVPSQLALISFQAPGSLGIPEFLNFSPAKSESVSGLAVADFDLCGGDDMIATIQTPEEASVGKASLFLNLNEAPNASITQTTLELEVGQSHKISATCADPTRDTRNYVWQIQTGDLGGLALIQAKGQLLGDETGAPLELQAQSPGHYYLRLSCVDLCGLKDEKTLSVNVLEKNLPADDDGPTDDSGDPTADTTGGPPLISQGGCLASLPVSVGPGGAGLVWGLGAALLFLRRLARRHSNHD